jgi:hypothetical protein
LISRMAENKPNLFDDDEGAEYKPPVE